MHDWRDRFLDQAAGIACRWRSNNGIFKRIGENWAVKTDWRRHHLLMPIARVPRLHSRRLDNKRRHARKY